MMTAINSIVMLGNAIGGCLTCSGQLALVQLHPLLKSLLFFLVWAGVWLPVALPLAIALKWRPPNPVTPTQKLPLLASLYLLAPLVLWGAATIDGLSVADYGLPWNGGLLRSGGLGLGIGVGGIALMFLIQKGVGWLTWQAPQMARSDDAVDVSRQPIAAVLVPILGLAIWISLTEELIFRGFLLNQLQSVYSPLLAAAIASLIFAVLHLVWEGRENVPQLPGLWVMGMVLALARWVDGGNLGLAWGLHAGWVWAIASLDTLQVITYSGNGSPWITGLDGKPLAGLMGLLFLGVTGWLLWVLF